MAKNSNSRKMKFVWIPLAALLIAVLTVLVPWLYGAGFKQAALVSTDVALAKADREIVSDLEELEEDGCKPAKGHTIQIAVLEGKFDTYHKEQKAANKEILNRLPPLPPPE